MRDLYALNKSPEINVETQTDYPASLQLTQASDLPYRLSGIVQNADGNTPIPNAFVAVYGSDGTYLAGDYADAGGEYSVTLDVGDNYKAIASASGFASSAPYTFSIVDTDMAQNFTLTAFSDEDRVIYGVVTESDGTTAIGDARIDVINSAGDVVASTVTIADGEYSVPDLALDTYSLVVSKPGFNTARDSVIIALGNTFVQKDKQLSARTEPTGSTISGYITQSDTTAIANAWVGLYTATDDLLQQTTSTNAQGYYCFEDVAENTYMVKSKAVEQ